jgi:high-affinity K+ transport system ATPase subunit B
MKAFKKGVDQTDAKQRREDSTIQIRKNKKEDRLAKRRGGGGPGFATAAVPLALGANGAAVAAPAANMMVPSSSSPSPVSFLHFITIIHSTRLFLFDFTMATLALLSSSYASH